MQQGGQHQRAGTVAPEPTHACAASGTVDLPTRPDDDGPRRAGTDACFHNHHITFSFSGSNFAHCRQAIKQGFNVAVPVLKSDFKRILIEFKNTFDGDKTDLRYLDKQKGKICLLSVNGNHKDENSFLLSYESFNNLLNKVHLN